MAQRKRKQGRATAAAKRASAPTPASVAKASVTPPLITPPLITPPLVTPAADAGAPVGTAPGTATAARQVKAQAKAKAKAAPTTQNEFLAAYAARAQARDAEARAKLVPLAPGERPWPIKVSVATCTILALANLVLFVAGVKIGHKPPSIFEVLAFVVLMSVCAGGMWVLWYQAVLAFMVLLGILIIYLCLFLVEASNLLGVVYPVVIVSASGFMFWKLVRVLARLQMPERRSRAAQR